MPEKTRISPLQLGMMMYLATTPTAILTAPTITYIFAKQDLWISPIWAFSGLIAVYVALRLHNMYPGLNISQASERIVTRLLGKIIGIMFSFFYLYLNGIIVREYGEFVVGAFLLNTPLIVVSGSMVLVCAITVRGGVEIVGRFSELLLPVFIAFFLLIIVPIIPDLRFSNMLPIMGEGIRPSIEGAFVLQTWFAELITVSFFLPYVADQRKAKTSISITFLIIILTLVVSNLSTLLLLGDLTGSFTYPFLILARYIDLAEFLTHLESLYMAIWVLGAFVKICVFFYVAVLVTSQWMNLSDYRPLVFPLGFLLVLLSMWVAPNFQELTHAIATSVTLSVLTMFVIVPWLLFCMAWVRNRLLSWR
ncbi:MULTISPECIES: GerAB/ArcD/ProY family transporter [Paenibacillus]|uniref:Spore gernimation protein n=1 Tax=Paenibacillus naphthalenovorans TaxID=162209 RepID=A0A0U2UDV7_9BACL|nr:MULTISPECIES: endospore germination permease [Paenibacillus]ALS21404.1 spore gernimation protein [Paenibacillus naphthalenovorans]